MKKSIFILCLLFLGFNFSAFAEYYNQEMFLQLIIILIQHLLNIFLQVTLLPRRQNEVL